MVAYINIARITVTAQFSCQKIKQTPSNGHITTLLLIKSLHKLMRQAFPYDVSME